MAYDLEAMRVERAGWQERNFPGDDAVTDCALGVMEEVGELTHHFLKKKQGIRGSAEEHDAQMKDAIGDLTVFLMGVCDGSEVNPNRARKTAVHRRAYPTSGRVAAALAKQAGILVDTALNARLTMLDFPRIGQIIILCERFCILQGWDYDAIVEDTWNHVKQRDWQANKETGGNEQVAPAHATSDPED